MRLIPVCLSLVLAPLMVGGQQTQPSTAEKPAQTSTTQSSHPGAHKAATSHRGRHHARKAAARRSAKRAGLCPATQMDVTVINGTQPIHVCIDKHKVGSEETKNTPGQRKVEVINGSTTGTQVFSDKNQETAHNQPVVVGVQSSDTRSAGGNQHPVVTGVTSSSSVDATSASSGGQTVTKQVSPRPKRPAYTPNER